MSNGCICCTLREDLMVEVERLARQNKFDYLLIESTGISEPIPVAQTFHFESEDGAVDLRRFSYIDTMVTVVDAYHFLKDFSSSDYLTTRALTNIEGDHRTIVNLLTDQIEFANVILINKEDLVTQTELEELSAILKKLNPEATLIPTTQSNVPLRSIINTGLFDYDKAEASAGWIKELENEHVPETEEYGIGSFVFRSKKPFHPDRFLHYLNTDFLQNIIRSKGLFWLASRSQHAIVWNTAGSSIKVENAGVWWGSMSPSERKKYAAFVENKNHIEKDWDSVFADRKIELVFIGQDLEKENMISNLNRCLLTEQEINMWKNQSFPETDTWPIDR